MMNRCYNPKARSYPDYGAKGIRVELLWHNVGKFIRDMAPTWGGGYNDNGERVTLDRISYLSNYGPGLCKWSTDLEQANNMSSNVPITINGVTKNLAQWSHERNIGPATIANRRELGWTDEEAVMTPVGTPRIAGTRAVFGDREKFLRAIAPDDPVLVPTRSIAASLQTIGNKIGIKVSIKMLAPREFPQCWVSVLTPQASAP